MAGVVVLAALAAHRRDKALVLFHPVAIIADQVGGLFHVAQRFGAILADLQRHDGADWKAALADQVGGLAHDLDALLPAQVTPDRERLARGGDGVTGVLHGALLKIAQASSPCSPGWCRRIARRAMRGLPPITIGYDLPRFAFTSATAWSKMVVARVVGRHRQRGVGDLLQGRLSWARLRRAATFFAAAFRLTGIFWSLSYVTIVYTPSLGICPDAPHRGDASHIQLNSSFGLHRSPTSSAVTSLQGRSRLLSSGPSFLHHARTSSETSSWEWPSWRAPRQARRLSRREWRPAHIAVAGTCVVHVLLTSCLSDHFRPLLHPGAF